MSTKMATVKEIRGTRYVVLDERVDAILAAEAPPSLPQDVATVEYAWVEGSEGTLIRLADGQDLDVHIYASGSLQEIADRYGDESLIPRRS